MDSQQRSMQAYLGVPIERPNVAFFELTSCEGCQLQIVNNEATLFNFLTLVNIVNFREVMTEKTDAFDIAFVEGSVTRADEVERLNLVRKTAKVLVAFGSCANEGCIPGLANLATTDELLTAAFEGPTTDNPDHLRPSPAFAAPEGELELPELLHWGEIAHVLANHLGDPQPLPAPPRELRP